jgi:hypothetical protein
VLEFWNNLCGIGTDYTNRVVVPARQATYVGGPVQQLAPIDCAKILAQDIQNSKKRRQCHLSNLAVCFLSISKPFFILFAKSWISCLAHSKLSGLKTLMRNHQRNHRSNQRSGQWSSSISRGMFYPLSTRSWKRRKLLKLSNLTLLYLSRVHTMDE